LNRLGFTPTIYSPDHSLVDKALVDGCHEKKIKLVPWTVNDGASLRALKDLGVDGIITDYPDLFKE
jgi:glycerophosphoryl diester phosphodiesterase